MLGAGERGTTVASLARQLLRCPDYDYDLKPHPRTNPWTFGFERRVLREATASVVTAKAELPAALLRSTARLRGIYGLPHDVQ